MRALARTFTGGVRAFVSRTARALARFLDTPAVAAAEPAPFSMTFPARTRPQGGAATHMGPLEPESEEHNAETAGAKWYGSPTEIGIAQKMVRDAHVRKSLEYIRAPIAAATWDFQAPEKTALAAEIADFCRYNFFALNDWRRVVRDGFLYLRDGFSLLELVEAVSLIPSTRFPMHPGRGVGLVLRGFEHRPAWSITGWKQSAASPAQLEHVQQYVSGGGAEVAGYRTIDAARLLRFTWEQEGAYFPGNAPLRSGYGPWKTKLVYLVVEAIKHERQGVGTPAMKLPPDAGDLEVDAAEQILSEMRAHHKGYVIEPDGFAFRWENGGDTTNIGEAIERCNRDIAYNVGFGHMLLGISGNKGSFALASTQDGQAQIGIEDHAAFFCGCVNHGLDGWSPVRRLVEANYGVGAPVPRLVARNLPTRDWSKYLAQLPALVNARLLTGDDTLEGFLREAMTLPARDWTTTREMPAPPRTPPGAPTPDAEDEDTASWKDAA